MKLCVQKFQKVEQELTMSISFDDVCVIMLQYIPQQPLVLISHMAIQKQHWGMIVFLNKSFIKSNFKKFKSLANSLKLTPSEIVCLLPNYNCIVNTVWH